MENKDALIEKLKEYIEFLGKHVTEGARCMHIHNCPTSQSEVDKGILFRAEIDRLEALIYQPLPLSDGLGHGEDKCCCPDRIDENAGCIFPKCSPYANQNASTRPGPSPQTAEGEITEDDFELFIHQSRFGYREEPDLDAFNKGAETAQIFYKSLLSSALSRIADLDERSAEGEKWRQVPTGNPGEMTYITDVPEDIEQWIGGYIGNQTFDGKNGMYIAAKGMRAIWGKMQGEMPGINAWDSRKIDRLCDVIGICEDEARELRSELSAANSKITDLIADVVHLNEECLTKEERIAELENNKDDLKISLERAERRIKELQEWHDSHV